MMLELLYLTVAGRIWKMSAANERANEKFKNTDTGRIIMNILFLPY